MYNIHKIDAIDLTNHIATQLNSKLIKLEIERQKTFAERRKENQFKRQKTDALELIFSELENHCMFENDIKMVLIGILENGILACIEAMENNEEIQHIREDVYNLIWVRDLIKMC